MRDAKGKKIVPFGRAPRMAILGLFAFVVILVLGLIGFSGMSDAAVSNTINFQARLENASGSIVPDGNYNIEFKLYDAVSGGTLLWTEDHLNNTSTGVHVVNGYVTVNLGSVTGFGTLNWNQQMWLTMNIGNTNPTCTPFSSCAPDGEMSPRIQLTALPYAFQAGELGNGTNKATLDGSGNFTLQQASTISTSVGNLTIQGAGSLTLQTATGAAPSGITLQPGASTAGNGTGALITIKGGNETSATCGTACIGGDLTLQGGDASGGAGTTNGGNINIDAGAGTTANGAINIGTVNSSTVNIGKTTGSGLINIGRSNGTYTFNIATTVPISTNAQTINIASAGTGQSSASTIAVNILSGSSGTNGTATLSLGDYNRITQIDLGNVAAASARTINIGTGNNAVGIDQINIGTGATTVSGGKEIHIGDGVPTGSGSNTVTIGSSALASSLLLQSGTGNLQLTTQGTGTLGIGNNSVAQSVVIGNTTGATSVLLQAGSGGVKVGTLGSVTVNSAAICRDISTNILTVCDSTNTTGRSFLQGGNSFGATANLGTNDINNLAFRTGGATKLTLNTSGNLQFSQASTINIASAATGTVLTIQGGAATSGASVGGNLVLQGGAGASTGASGSVLVKSNTNNSTTAFQIQDASGYSLLTADTTNSTVKIRSGSDVKTLGAELYSGDFSVAGAKWTGVTNTVCGTTNWYVGVASQAQHCPNAANTTKLINTSVAITAGTTYQVSFVLGGTCSATDAYLDIYIGNTYLAEVNGTDCSGGTYTYVGTASNTSGLTFDPLDGTWAGTVSSISIKALSGTINPSLVVQNLDGSTNLEVRVSSSSGNDNLFMGNSSGANNESGEQNLGIGTWALQGNSSGSFNTALGFQALSTNATGSNNTALGREALWANTTGNQNTGVGDSALGYNTVGIQNAALGYSALATNTTGSNNNAFGANSLYANTTGNGNSAFGDSALSNSDQGSGNTAVGYEALYSDNTSAGNYNTALGYQAGYCDSVQINFCSLSNLNLSLQNATAIGAYSQVQANNSIVLGSVDLGTKVGIGITVPSNTFSVSPLDYNLGNAKRTNGSATISGSGTSWTTAMVGDVIIFYDGGTGTVGSVTNGTTLVLTSTWMGATDPGFEPYRLHHVGLQVTSGGYLGINTVSPATPLDVNGNASISGQLNASPTTSLPSYVNLVPNWSFEVNNDSVANFPDQWGPSNETAGTVSVLTTSSTNGKNSLELSSGASSSNIAATSSCFPISPSQTYSYATDAYSSAATNGFVWRVFYFTDSSCTTAASTAFSDVTGTFNNAITASWQTFTGTQTSPNNAYFAWIRVYNYQTTNSNLVIDSMVMTPQFKTGLLVTRTDTSAFKIQNASSTNIFSVDSSGKNVIIGVGATGEATPSLLVLDSKNATDSINPGTTTCTTDGSIYYNGTDDQFRGCRAGKLYNLIAGVDYQVFTSGTSWTKPSGVSIVLVIACGGGGGGGGGRGQGTGTNRQGGTGGGGGTYISKIFYANDLGSSVSYTIGTGGNGGGSNANGSTGTATTFGTGPVLLTAPGGGPGAAGPSTAANTSGGGGGGFITNGPAASTSSINGADTPSGYTTTAPAVGIGWTGGGATTGSVGKAAQYGGGGGGGTAGTLAQGAQGGDSINGGGGGGGGGSVNTVPTVFAGGNAGGTGTYGTGGGGSGGSGTTGTAGANATTGHCGTGGGGGGGVNGTPGANGGAGGTGGGGGGGGGGGTTTGGTGGAGGGGELWVISW